MKNFRELIVWQKAHQLVLEIYPLTQLFPADERFGLVSQMRRAAVSVPANIVEGHKRKSRREFAHFTSIAEGSLEELKYYLHLSRDLGYVTEPRMIGVFSLAEEVGRVLHGLKRHLNKEIDNAP